MSQYNSLVHEAENCPFDNVVVLLAWRNEAPGFACMDIHIANAALAAKAARFSGCWTNQGNASA